MIITEIKVTIKPSAHFPTEHQLTMEVTGGNKRHTATITMHEDAFTSYFDRIMDVVKNEIKRQVKEAKE
jgi:hypothetical protein